MTTSPVAAPVERLISRAQFADLIGMSIRTLEKWEQAKYGPMPTRFGRSVRYNSNDVTDFILRRKYTSTLPAVARSLAAKRRQHKQHINRIGRFFPFQAVLTRITRRSKIVLCAGIRMAKASKNER